jgi:PAS domain S-box-containing protein
VGSEEGAAKTILIVEDEQIVAKDIARGMARLGYEVVGTVHSGAEAIRRSVELRPDLILMDIRLPGGVDGVEAAGAIRRRLDVPIIYLTAFSDADTLARATSTEPFGYVLKPFNETELRCAIELALYKHEAERRLREREQFLATTLRSIGEAVVITDARAHTTFLNQAAQALTDCTAADAIGRVVTDVFQLVREDTGEPIGNPLRDGVTLSSDQAVLVRRDGTRVAVDHSASPIVGDDGTVLGGVIVLRDVSEPRQARREIVRLNAELERRVAERTALLATANQELESFSYSVAHDLRAPLRSIDGFSQAVLEDYGARLDETGRAHLHRVRAGAQRMARLIDDLLGLARLARTELRWTTVDLASLARRIEAELRAAHPTGAVQLDVQDGLRAECDGDLMRIVLQNLLGNAWKFTARSAAPRVAFFATERQGEQVFAVRDNGAGFDMTYADKLFGAFQRLHTADEFEGTGIGLATVQRIIHLHGGRVWAEGAIDRGATFYFTLG